MAVRAFLSDFLSEMPGRMRTADMLDLWPAQRERDVLRLPRARFVPIAVDICR